jgi:hypothetical protein
MRRTGVVSLPLHGGRCPSWLFPRMVQLCREISKIILLEYSVDQFLKRMSNPFFFQALGCVLGFDWHSSGLTTTTCAALKEALNRENLGVKVAGGKGSASKKTPEEIRSLATCDVERLVYASRLSAKVDNALVQDGYQLYHHTILFSEAGSWTVVQQGLNPENGYARRYHWLSTKEVKLESFVEEPHQAICCDRRGETLDLTSKRSQEAREVSLDLVKDDPKHLEKYLTGQTSLVEFHLPRSHLIPRMGERCLRTLRRVYEAQPRTYEELVSFRGVGPKTVRALALISKLIYGAELSWVDPAKYSFAHGGKDGIPYPVNIKLMEESTQMLKQAIEEAKIGVKDKINALKRLKTLI